MLLDFYVAGSITTLNFRCVTPLYVLYAIQQ